MDFQSNIYNETFCDNTQKETLLFQRDVTGLLQPSLSPVDNMFNYRNRNTRTRCELCYKRTIKTIKTYIGFLSVLIE